MNRTGTLALLALAACGASALAALPAAAGTTIPVTVVAGSGSRTLTLTAPDGTALDATHGLTLGAGKTAAIVAGVTDSTYSHVGYQVSATMSNLYPYTGTTYNFAGTPISSSAVSMATPAAPLDLANVSATVQPVLSLSGNLTSVLGPIIALLPGGTTLTNVVTQVTAAPQSLAAVASHVVDGTLAGLPIRTSSAQSGAFTTPASLGVGDPVQGGTPTTMLLVSGTPQTGTLSSLVSSLQSTLGAQSVTSLISSGVLDQSSVLTGLASTLGIPASLLSLVNVTNLLGALTPTVTSLTGGLLGQSGTANSNATLQLATPSNLAPGTYKGVLTVTLADVP
jgi:hypothetical protein